MADEVVIRAEGLTKRYGATLAVDNIDLAVDAGEIVGILGPNGSGKTTTILMLLGLTEPTGGRAVVAGFDPLRQFGHAARQRDSSAIEQRNPVAHALHLIEMVRG